MRPRDNITKAAIVAIIKFLVDNDAREKQTIAEILVEGFDWGEQEVEEKLDNYINRINKIENLQSLVVASKLNIAENLRLEEQITFNAIEKMKENGFLIQYGRGHGKIFGLVGRMITFDDLENFAIEFDKDHGEEVVPAPEAVNALDVDNFDDPGEAFLHFARTFEQVANKFGGMTQGQAEEIEELREQNATLLREKQAAQRELELLKRTSWQ